MLNTRTCWGAAAVWTVIALIVTTVLWSLLDWPPPDVAWSDFLRSELAAAIRAFQFLLGSVIGFAILAATLWANSARDRRERASDIDRRTRTLAHALMLETERLEADCDLAAARFSSLAGEADRKGNGEAPALSASHRAALGRSLGGGLMLSELSPATLTRLGANACGGLLGLKSAVADLDRERAELAGEPIPAPGAAELREVSRAYAAICLRCARLRPVLWTLWKHGADVADAREPVGAPSRHDVEARINAAGRLADAAAMTPGTDRGQPLRA